MTLGKDDQQMSSLPTAHPNPDDREQKQKSTTCEQESNEQHALISGLSSCNISRDKVGDDEVVSKTSSASQSGERIDAADNIESTEGNVVQSGVDPIVTRVSGEGVTPSADATYSSNSGHSSLGSTSAATADVTSRPPSSIETSTVTSHSDKSTTVTVTAGGITATITTTVEGSSSTTCGHSVVSTAPAVTPRQSSVTCPDLSAGVFPLTGVPSRSERLPQLRTTTLDNYLQDEEEARVHALTPLQAVYEGGTGLIFNRPTPANVVRKCVYMYEDKYSFCR
jgi:hypothetical protein